MHTQTDVLVVGAGPAGISAALFLAKLGINAVTITKYPWLADTPRAHITNQRTIEVFRDQGLEAKMKKAAIPQEKMANVCWMKRFNEQEICRFEAWGGGAARRHDYELAGPSSMCNLSQHIMEPIIHQGAVDAGADVRFNKELIDFTQDDDGVLATVKDRKTGATETIQAKYMIGADGGNSMIADKLGISFKGQAGLGSAVTAWIEADLRPYVEQRPSVLYWVVQPGGETWLGTGCYVAVREWDEWMLLFVVGIDEDPDLSEARIIAQVREHAGDPNLKVKLKRTGRWTVNNLVAEKYRKGRVFIAGDAAHRHPPANGLGTNTSVQDAYNLCWKLAYVLKGFAGESLLDSYEDERQPIGEQIVTRAIKSMGNLVPVMESIAKDGVDTKGDINTDILFSDNEKGAQRRRELRDALNLQNWHFNALGIEIGQHYFSKAVKTDGQEKKPPTKDPELYIEPDTVPGSRLPHVWLMKHGEKVSTHDITGKGRFVLLTGTGGSEWIIAAQLYSQKTGVPLLAEKIGLGEDNADVFFQWADVCEIEDGGALIVRPDAHIAWRCKSLPEDPLKQLTLAMDFVLTRSNKLLSNDVHSLNSSLIESAYK
ncbi:FAD-dependent monooxygenase [Alteromonas sp. P256]|uniref:FAD-dependent monooxygenase n=1 Tax=Alteromonas sp. P256 TaxID=3117399 RepID=UPI002FE20F48